MAEGSIWTNRPAAEAGTTAPGVGLATRPAGAFYARTPRRRDAGGGDTMLVVTLDRNRLGYVVARAVRRTCRQCCAHWWRVYALPGGYPRDYELPAQWAGGLFVREWESRSLAHYVSVASSVLVGASMEPATMVDDDNTVLARGLFVTGLFHEGPVGGYRRLDQDAPAPWIVGWELIVRYCLPRPGHHVRGVWRCWRSRDDEEARASFSLDLEEEVTLCRHCSEQQAAEQSEEGSATG